MRTFGAAILVAVSLTLALGCGGSVSGDPGKTDGGAGSGGYAGTGGNGGNGGGIPCGNTTCAAGEYCCNASCNLCAPQGAGCTTIACAPEQCGDVTCGLGEQCCSPECGYCGPIGEECPDIDCAPVGQPCGNVVCGPGQTCCDAACGLCADSPMQCSGMVSCKCAPQDAYGQGPCAAFLGYKWDGGQCVGISGCTCTGSECDQVWNYDTCIKEHAECPQYF